ncbi:MAG: hypothetical protein ABH851_03890 [Methanobacteriota archaeon]
MSKWTPGPWEVADCGYPSLRCMHGASFDVICCIQAYNLSNEESKRRKADLTLISAAPDLAEALEAVAATIPPVGAVSPSGCAKLDLEFDFWNLHKDTMVKICAALDKAKGERKS